MRIFRTVFVFLTGILSGIFVAQGLIVLAGRRGGNFGGEMLVLPLIGLLIYMGVMIGRMFPERPAQHKKRRR